MFHVRAYRVRALLLLMLNFKFCNIFLSDNFLAPILMFFRYLTLVASGDAHRRKEDTAIQAGKPGNVRLGDSRSTAGAKDMRSEHHTVGQLG